MLTLIREGTKARSTLDIRFAVWQRDPEILSSVDSNLARRALCRKLTHEARCDKRLGAVQKENKDVDIKA